jgi:hypothetical protein
LAVLRERYATKNFQSNALTRRTIPNMSRARRLSWIYNSLEFIYFKQYSSQASCVRNIAITGGGYVGNVGQFLDLCNFVSLSL